MPWGGEENSPEENMAQAESELLLVFLDRGFGKAALKAWKDLMNLIGGLFWRAGSEVVVM